MIINNNTTTLIQSHGVSYVDELLNIHNKESKTLDGHNLFTVYLNSFIGFSKADEFIDGGYLFQPQSIQPEILNSFYKFIFFKNNFLDKEKILAYKNKLFTQDYYPSDSYWTLTLPLLRRFDLFYFLYSPTDVLVDDKANIVDALFSQGMMNFSSLEEWKVFSRNIKLVFKFLIKEKKISIMDIDKLTENKKIEEMYTNQVFIYYKLALEADRLDQLVHSNNISPAERTVEEKNPGEELSKLKVKLIKYHYETILKEKSDPEKVQKL